MQTIDSYRLTRLYHTAHLIVYYFIQIEGEKGVSKIRRCLDENRKSLYRYQQYQTNFKTYERDMAAFVNLPGVTRLPDNRIQYPSNLQPPKAPEPPFTDPSALKMAGLGILLNGESLSVVGARIEKVLNEHLGMNLQFVERPSTGRYFRQ